MKKYPKLVFRAATAEEYMGIELPDGRDLLLEPCSEDDAEFLREVVRRYNNFGRAVDALTEDQTQLDAIGYSENSGMAADRAAELHTLIRELEQSKE